MIKKNVWLVLYAMLLAFLSVSLFLKIQERNLTIKLNNHNLSADAYLITLKDKMTVAQLDDKLQNSSKLENVQVHYQDKKRKNITYFYGVGNFAIPPMLKGSFFSLADFKSQVNVAVVGQNYEKKLYTPKDQSYLKMDNKYIPVLGVMGNHQDTDLDNQIFISLNEQQRTKVLANNFRIVIDGKHALNKHSVRKILNASGVRHLNRKHFLIQQDSWVVSHLSELLGLALITLAFLSGAFMCKIFARREYLEAVFLKKDVKKFIFEEWQFFALFNGLGTIFGIIIGLLAFDITEYVVIFVYNLGVFLLTNCLYVVLLKKQIKKLNKGD
ncbi:ABC transporter permease [Liquorilactobacillus uvarum]|uniref:ABC transporter permease n=1 Tax=Liquorilactobacillus uvarum TaxID=303240 RepID=UPI00288C2C97|nr:ABC transporter permease [Liquorilactobacillus uvarum]